MRRRTATGSRSSRSTCPWPSRTPPASCASCAPAPARASCRATRAPAIALLQAADLLPAAGRGAAARAAAQAAQFTVIVSNVPGPPVRLGLLGRELRAVHPAVPLLDGHALTIGAISYRDRLYAGLYADAAVVPDSDLLAADLERALDTIRTLAPRPRRRGRPAPAPGATGCRRPSAAGSAYFAASRYDRPVDRDDVDATARVLAERGQRGHVRKREHVIAARMPGLSCAERSRLLQ